VLNQPVGFVPQIGEQTGVIQAHQTPFHRGGRPLPAATDSGALAAICSANDCVTATSSSGSASRLTNPISKPHAADSGAPVKTSSIAMRRGIIKEAVPPREIRVHLHLGNPELCGGGCHAQVTDLGQQETAGEGHPVDRGDRRFVHRDVAVSQATPLRTS
jgi:hypothetical protein